MTRPIAWRELTPQITTRNLIVVSAAMVLLNFLVQGNAGFMMSDEGFLWYGTIRTALGDVPLRDFQSYDPGRYYWGALWFKLLRSDGMIALRISQAVFQFLGLSVAFLVLRRILRSWLAILTAGLVLLIWMFPAFKIYEPVITIIAVYLAVLLIENPSKQRHFVAGVFVGLAAFFGRNHGLYCFAAYLLLILFIWWKNDWQVLLGRLAAWSLGIVIGYSPMLLMVIFIPGFFRAVLVMLLANLHNGTNLPLPVPWPWRLTNYSHTFKEWLNKFAIGLTYLAFSAFYLLASVALLLKPRFRRNAVLVASTFVGVTYLHYTFDRAHLYYLAWTIPPFIFGLIALPYSFSGRHRRKLAVMVWSCLLMLSWTAADMAPENYFLIKAKSAVRSTLLNRFHLNVGLDMPYQRSALVKTDIRGDKLWIPKDDAAIVDIVKAIDNELIPADDGILVAPYLTGLYPILRKPSPVWESYFLYPQPRDGQERMVEDLERKHIKWAIVCNLYLDGRPELAFRNTHSLVWQYLVANFETIHSELTDRLPPECELYHRRAPGVSPQASPSKFENVKP